MAVTLHQAILEAVLCLSAHEDLRADAARDAELLLLHLLAAPRTARFTDADRPLTQRELSDYDLLIRRRLAGEPVQYILGQQEFYGLVLKVTPDVLIPRPETELLVETVLQRLPAETPLRIVDVGTGSGAIAIALAKHLLLAEVTAVDLSPAALDVARQNAQRHGLAERLRFVQSDLLDGILCPTAGVPQGYAAVVSNPPYVPDSDRATLHRQVRDFEPATALFAGNDGLDIYRRLIPQAATALVPGGLLAMEIGYGQQAALAHLLRDWQRVEFLDDLQGVPRLALARAPA
jgi:release factor glutamine methyltransferase